MLTAIRFLSLAEFNLLSPDPRMVVISILDRAESGERPLLSGFRSALELEFYDAYESSGEAWPDHVDLQDAPNLCGIHFGERPPSIADAAAIASFCQRHHASQEKLVLVAHCFAGLSRSAAVAAWASGHFRVPLDNPHGRDTRLANPRLTRLLKLATGGV